MAQITGSSSIDWSTVSIPVVDFEADAVQFVNRIDQIITEFALGEFFFVSISPTLIVVNPFSGGTLRIGGTFDSPSPVITSINFTNPATDEIVRFSGRLDGIGNETLTSATYDPAGSVGFSEKFSGNLVFPADFPDSGAMSGTLNSLVANIGSTTITLSGNLSLTATSAAASFTGTVTAISVVSGANTIKMSGLSIPLDDIEAALGTAALDSVDDVFSFVGNYLTGNDVITYTNNSPAGIAVYGGAGNDTITVKGANADTLVGGEGDDTYVHSPGGANDVYIENFSEGIDTINAAVTFDLSSASPNIENLTLTGTGHLDGTGNALNNVLTGNSGNNVLSGGDGDDILIGKGGADSLVGGIGNDWLDGGAGGADTMVGGVGDDKYLINDSFDVITELAGEGSDTVLINRTIDLNLAPFTEVEHAELLGTGAINATGDAGDNMLTGNAGNNMLAGGDGNDTLIGGAGNDTLYGGAGDDSQDGGTGNDGFLIADAAEHGAGETINGGAGADVIRFTSTTGGQVLTLAAGVMLVESVVIGNALGVTTGTTALDVDASAVGGRLSIIGNNGTNTITGTAFNDVINGNSGDDSLDGGIGNDTILGGAGNDTLIGGTGNDRLIGGTGNDLYFVDASTDAVIEALNAGTDTVIASANYTLGDNLENLELTGGALNGTGNALNNVLTGNAGANVLNGGAGHDTIDGGAGEDTVNGGGGNDRITMRVTAGDVDAIDAGAGVDTLVLSGAVDGDGVVVVNLSSLVDQVTRIGTADPEMLAQKGFEHLDASGIGSSVNATGSAGANLLIGSNGADMLDGLAGNDTINGGASDDTLEGGAGTDTLDYTDSPARAIVNLSETTWTVGGDPVDGGNARDGFGTTDTISGFESVVGSDFNDFIIGNNGVKNLLEGGNGNDTIMGGVVGDISNDTLVGGAGNDELRQTRGADVLDGGDGNDWLVFSNDSNTVILTGINYSGATGVNVNLAAHTSDYDTSDAGNPLGKLVSIENVSGTDGNDRFVGGDRSHAPDRLGNATTEIFEPLGGDDTIIGGTGNGFNTRIDYSANTNAQAVNVDLGTRTALDGLGGTDTLIRVDHVFGGAGDDTLYGGSLERSSSGGFFELFRGNAGDDLIDGAGTDTILGAAGSDRVNYGSSPNPVNVDLGDGVLDGTASDGFGFTDTLRNIDQVQGSNHDDTLVGGASNHRLIGHSGDDLLVGTTSGVEASYQSSTGPVVAALGLGGGDGAASDGMGGNDILSGIDDLRGSDFNDMLTGNELSNRITGDPGDDTIDGGAGIDFASYQSTPRANGGINALIANGAGSVKDGFGSTDTLTNIEGLIGTHSADTLRGGADDQWFVGRGGSDLINGGAGNDWVSYAGDPAGVTVNLGAGTGKDGWGGVWAMGGTDTLVSIENVAGSNFNDRITGNAMANELRGLAGNDTLNGGGGDDTLLGGLGHDTLSGGGGSDIFDYDALVDAGDTIKDFNAVGAEKLDLVDLLDALGYAGIDPETDGYLRWQQQNADTVVQIDADGGGDNFSVTLATLEGVDATDLSLADNFFV